MVGLGYVGLPLACLAAEKGWQVIGIARDRQKLDLINRHRSPIPEKLLQRWLRRVTIRATADFAPIASADVVVICVPTPVDHHNNPDFSAIIASAKNIAKYLRRGQLVVLESTVSPGVSEEVLQPILESHGLRAGRDFLLAHCPERIDPGNATWTVRNIPRVIGGFDHPSTRRAMKFYQSIIEAPLQAMASLKEAEAVKILENSFRDVNIAFVNEIAMSFERLGIDTVDVIRGAATKPFAFLPHWPSAGVGGHCIPVDPYYLIERAKKSGFNHAFLKLARAINNGMPEHALSRLFAALKSKRRAPGRVTIGVLGLAYKKNVSDTRESPAYRIIALLRQRRLRFHTFDPHIPGESTVRTINEFLRRVDAVILMTDHDEFARITPQKLKKNGIIAVVDGKNLFDKRAMTRSGIAYRGIGR
ncbi:MAG: nucleotide sugar dehydrogenase [Candidatus Kerfeldbacteria bacterium]|nr:nucleotide sugar dehydrogenase [Candidatus Kerfeldbacteria bacterium]